ncbi:cell division protein ZapA [Shewanella sp. NIFS-20-20]|uniref:cell division protein ZapA n=1 Tax=Shewanella sp. NIFS-20-20 TaxID=2853806 RepID=UPI001C48C911|nr:cell division protein ZapA [Shewanella sp. NIFS-20-20]MBV7317370.1 cell division protein ZapA [Shewanella sp. NIFS-20-20]
MSNRAVDITLLGRTYSIACPVGQEAALKQVAVKLEQQLTSMRARTNSLSREDIAIMAALNIGYELYEEKMKNQDYIRQMDERIGLLQSTLENALVERSHSTTQEPSPRQDDPHSKG